LRTVYPLTRMDRTEVLRKAVHYELPPLMRGPGQALAAPAARRNR
jgi:hypothetical protein